MRKWVFVIFSVCLAGGVITLLSSGGKYEKYIKFVCGTVCLLAVISPVKEGFESIKHFALQYTEENISLPDGNEYTAEQITEKMTEYIKDILLKNGINDGEVCIDITVTDTEITVGEIQVFVSAEHKDRAEACLNGIAEVKSDG